MTTLADIIEHMEKSLEWRGPSGRSLGHIVLDRPQAELLLQKVYDLRRQAGEMK